MDLAKGAVGVGMWSCWGEELVESGAGFLSPQKLAAGDRSVGGCHHVRIWTYWIPALLPSPSCNWATRLWPHSRIWKELLGLAGSLGRVKGAGGAWDPTCSLRSLELMLWILCGQCPSLNLSGSAAVWRGPQEVASKPWQAEEETQAEGLVGQVSPPRPRGGKWA